jgi:hypothetical protein
MRVGPTPNVRSDEPLSVVAVLRAGAVRGFVPEPRFVLELGREVVRWGARVKTSIGPGGIGEGESPAACVRALGQGPVARSLGRWSKS